MDQTLAFRELNKLKLELKLWEAKFLEDNGRKPSQKDISNDTADVQDMYRKYSELKKLTCKKQEDAPKAESISKVHCDVWSTKLNKDIKPVKDIHSHRTIPLKFTANIRTYAEKLRAKQLQLKQKTDHSSITIQETPDPRTTTNIDESQLEANLNEIFKPMYKIKVNDVFKDDDSKPKPLNPLLCTASKLSLPNKCRNFLDKSCFKDDQQLAAPTASETIPDHMNSSESASTTVIGKCDKFDMSSLSSQAYKNDVFKNVDQEISTITSRHVPCKQEALSNLLNECVVVNKGVEPSTVKEKSDIYAWNGDDIKDLKTKETQLKDPVKRKRVSTTKSRASLTDEENSSEPSRKKRKVPTNGCFSSTTLTKHNGRNTLPKENYVRINLKKRVFVRGKKNFNYRRFKYGQWLKRHQNRRAFGDSSVTCKPSKLKEDRSDEDLDNASLDQVTDLSVSDHECHSELTVASEAIFGDEVTSPKMAFSGVDPVFELINNEAPTSALDEIQKILKLFGHDHFRNGQLKAIIRILAGLSTLLIQPTGSGKSLCYLLPAYMYAKRSSCITLVISPLVSLMEDQVERVPSCLKAACIHTNMTAIQRDKVRRAISNKKIDILFLSPEALVGAAGSSFSILPSDMAPIAFVCIDEVHCVSAWSHNFRPSYLRLCKIIRETLKIKCILGLTATATNVAIDSIVNHLDLTNDKEAIIRGTFLPLNLRLTVSRDHREEALLNLLNSEPYSSCHSIIIYCIRREQTERLAMLIRTCFRQGNEELCAEAYHAGLSAARRKKVQNRFMSGKLRVVVATVAFGMGLNKSDVRAVIHYNMPKNIESYIQEVGRAGRDGQPSYCHVFLEQTASGEDRQELKRHIFADIADRAALRKLLNRVFQPCKCNRLQELESSVFGDSEHHGSVSGTSSYPSKPLWSCPGHEIAFPIDETIEEMDLKEEGIDTLLCYLELHPDGYVHLLNRMYGTCSLICYGGSEQLKSLLKQCPPVAVGMAFQKQLTTNRGITNNSIAFPLVKVASLMGCESLTLKKQLLKLQWIEYKNGAGETKYRKSGIVVNFKDLSFHLRSVGSLTENKMDDVLTYLHDQVLRHEERELDQLENFYRVLNSLSFVHYGACEGNSADEKSEILKNVIKEYFENSSSLSRYASNKSIAPDNPLDAVGIRSDIRNFLSIYKGEYTFTGRAVARIFHGIGSPRYPVEVWGKVRRFWRCHLNVDFNELSKIATEEIIRFR